MSDFRFLCDVSEVNREREGYASALRRSRHSISFSKAVPQDDSGSWLVFPEPPQSAMPRWLSGSQNPTICFQIDVFSKPQWRALWSALFDYVVIFHPGYEKYFEKFGHSGVVVLPHAVDPTIYRARNSRERDFEIGWVGTIDGPRYEQRRQILPRLATRYRVNDWRRRYREENVV